MYMNDVRGKVKIIVMKFPILLQAVSDTKAHRMNLRVNAMDRIIGTW